MLARRPVPTDGLWPIVTPVVAAALILAVGAFMARKWQPLQTVTLQALQAHIAVLESERRDQREQLDLLHTQVTALGVQVDDLRGQVLALTSENLALRGGTPALPRAGRV